MMEIILRWRWEGRDVSTNSTPASAASILAARSTPSSPVVAFSAESSRWIMCRRHRMPYRPCSAWSSILSSASRNGRGSLRSSSNRSRLTNTATRDSCDVMSATVAANYTASTDEHHQLILRTVITALHVMQTRYGDENSVRPSVRPSVRLSVCHTRELWQNVRKICPDFFVPHERWFSLVYWKEEWLVGATPSTWNFGSTVPRWSKIADFEPIIARSASVIM